ncbi:MAG: hypothetical protein HY747_04835 [Elusimicrobia bacterium]|nr:hypothetical protein [Elusimicrobiota bacterium]
MRYFIWILVGVFIGACPSAHATHLSSGVQAGDRGGILLPVENRQVNTLPLNNVRLEIFNAPLWFHVLDTSLLGPQVIYPGERLTFRIDFEVDQSFTPADSNVTMDIFVVTDSAGILPRPNIKWHLKSKTAFQMFSAECSDAEGIFCGDAIASDDTSPITELIFDGSFFMDEQNEVFIATATEVVLEANDPFIIDERHSNVAFTGLKVDQPAQNINELDLFVSPLTFSQGSHFIVFASSDFAGNAEAIKQQAFFVDGIAPASPQDLRADGSLGVSPWKNFKSFEITLQGQDDASGVAGAYVKLGTPPTSSTDGNFISNFTSFNFTSGNLVNGGNPLYVWLQDNVGNADHNTAGILNLRFDDLKPWSSASVFPSTFSAGPVPIVFVSTDATSGVDKTFLWGRKDTNGDGVFGQWQKTDSEASGTNGMLTLTPAPLPQGEGTIGGDGNYQFYTQAKDVAGNFEEPPVSTTVAKASAFVDQSSPAISNIAAPLVSFGTAKLTWTTDDKTTGIVSYGTQPENLTPTLPCVFAQDCPAGLPSPIEGEGYRKEHSVILNSLVSPARIYFKITAINKTGLRTESQIGNFTTPVKKKRWWRP